MDDISPARRPSKLCRTHGGDNGVRQFAIHSQTICEASIFSCADYILPFLEPPELAAVASTCKALNSIARAINIRRSTDASRGFEKYHIPFVNLMDDQPYSYFIYTRTQLRNSDAIRRQAWGFPNSPIGVGSSQIGDEEEEVSFESGSGCDCERCGEECPCGLGFEDVGVVSECGKGCGCGMECGKRMSQRGICVRLKIVKNGRKGWGLYAAEFIQRGQFVCEYAGELLTTNEARRRQAIYDQCSKNCQSSSALLVVREHLPSGKACLRINIDATKVGNIGRFINHSCDGGNLSSIIIRSSGTLLPRLCFYASTDIQEGDELSFSYGSTRLRSNGLQCLCGCSSCCGSLPSEVT
ncbi:unnamed protein product [Rhodiola kirilowii]